jgi:sigma-B regulation protein RsbU (phosphoserine phosphatase)
MFDSSTYASQRAHLEPGDLLVLYSDGITEAESPSGTPFDEEGLVSLIRAHGDDPDLVAIGKAIIKAVERHAQDVRFADDLTVLLARRPSAVEVPPIPNPESRAPSPEPRNPPAPPSVQEP